MLQTKQIIDNLLIYANSIVFIVMLLFRHALLLFNDETILNIQFVLDFIVSNGAIYSFDNLIFRSNDIKKKKIKHVT